MCTTNFHLLHFKIQSHLQNADFECRYISTHFEGINDFLDNRTQETSVNGQHSSWVDVTSGVTLPKDLYWARLYSCYISMTSKKISNQTYVYLLMTA